MMALSSGRLLINAVNRQFQGDRYPSSHGPSKQIPSDPFLREHENSPQVASLQSAAPVVSPSPYEAPTIECVVDI